MKYYRVLPDSALPYENVDLAHLCNRLEWQRSVVEDCRRPSAADYGLIPTKSICGYVHVA